MLDLGRARSAKFSRTVGRLSAPEAESEATDDDHPILRLPRTVAEAKLYDFDHGIDLFKFYVRALIQGNLFAVAINGSIATYVLKNYLASPSVGLALALPFSLSLIVFVLHLRALVSAGKFKKQMLAIQNDLGLSVGPLMVILPWMIWNMILLHLLSIIGIIVLAFLAGVSAVSNPGTFDGMN